MMLSADAYTVAKTLEQVEAATDAVGLAIAIRMMGGGMVLAAGNGGSAAQAQHFAAELTGRYLKERKAMPAIALNADTAAVTAIANDYGYEHVFARQVEAFADPKNVLVLFSTSGKSKNVIEAARVAQANDMLVVGITGRDGGPLARECSLEIRVWIEETPLIQAAHLMVAHEICRIVEDVCHN